MVDLMVADLKGLNVLDEIRKKLSAQCFLALVSGC